MAAVRLAAVYVAVVCMAVVRREPPGFSRDNPAGRAGRLAPFRCHFAMAYAVPGLIAAVRRKHHVAAGFDTV